MLLKNKHLIKYNFLLTLGAVAVYNLFANVNVVFKWTAIALMAMATIINIAIIIEKSKVGKSNKTYNIRFIMLLASLSLILVAGIVYYFFH